MKSNQHLALRTAGGDELLAGKRSRGVFIGPMSENQKHTPLPWYMDPGLGRYEIWRKDHRPTYTYIGVVERQDDAEFIVRACNSHQDLLAACRLMLSWYGPAKLHGGRLDIESELAQVHAAIAKAENQPSTH